MRNLNQRIARTYVEILGGKLIRNAQWEEYIVKVGQNTYHCTDLDDAIGTASAMLGSSDNVDKADAYLRECGVA